jgi:hypothetical protein
MLDPATIPSSFTNENWYERKIKKLKKKVRKLKRKLKKEKENE